jgi:hypothetical protein
MSKPTRFRGTLMPTPSQIPILIYSSAVIATASVTAAIGLKLDEVENPAFDEARRR